MRHYEVDLCSLSAKNFTLSLSVVSFVLQAPSLSGFVHQFPAVPHWAEGPGAAARGDDERSSPGPDHSAPPCVCAPLCQCCCTTFCVPAHTGRCPPIRLHNHHVTAQQLAKLGHIWCSELSCVISRRQCCWEYLIIVIQPVKINFFLISNIVTS